MFFKKKLPAEEQTLTKRFRIRETLFGKIVLQVMTLGGYWRDATLDDWMLISAVERTEAALKITNEFQEMLKDHLDRDNLDDFKDTVPVQRFEKRDDDNLWTELPDPPEKPKNLVIAGDDVDKTWERLLTPKERTKLAEVRERYNPDLTVQQFIEAQKYLADIDRQEEAKKKAGRPGWTQLNGRG